jgi:hypothetical protein
MFDVSDIWEMRPLSSLDLGAIISFQRKERGWTQETLAELAGVTTRALARAFEYPDIDAFNKPWQMPNVEKLNARQEKLERETVELKVDLVTSGRQLRELADLSEACLFHQVVDMPRPAAESLAVLQDYFRDYCDVHDCYSATQKLDVDQDFHKLMEELGAAGFAVSAGIRRMVIRDDQPSEMKPLPLTATYVIIAPKDQPLSSVCVPRRHSFQC